MWGLSVWDLGFKVFGFGVQALKVLGLLFRAWGLVV